jgi:hypothetical protein
MTTATTDGRIMEARVARLAEELETLEAQARAIEEAREALSAMIRERDHDVDRIGSRLQQLGRSEVWRDGHIYHFAPGKASGWQLGKFLLTVRPAPAAADVFLPAEEWEDDPTGDIPPGSFPGE